MRGLIISSGFASGHRVVVGRWHGGPLGPMTDVMWAEPAGRRTLLAPNESVAAFITSVYAFDAVEIVPIEVEASARRLVIAAGSRRLEFDAGRAVRIPVRRPAWFTREPTKIAGMTRLMATRYDTRRPESPATAAATISNAPTTK